jgi:hypothetical protein
LRNSVRDGFKVVALDSGFEARSTESSQRGTFAPVSTIRRLNKTSKMFPCFYAYIQARIPAQQNQQNGSLGVSTW